MDSTRTNARRRIEWLGDSVVPHQAEVVGWIIRELEYAEAVKRLNEQPRKARI